MSWLTAIRNRPGSALMFAVCVVGTSVLFVVTRSTGPIEAPWLQPWMILAFWPGLFLTAVFLDSRAGRRRLGGIESDKDLWRRMGEAKDDRTPFDVRYDREPMDLPAWGPNRAYSTGALVMAEGRPWRREWYGMSGATWALDKYYWHPVRLTRLRGDEIEAWAEAWDPSTGKWHELEVQP